MNKRTCISGVQPSGKPSLGNYIGAFVPFTSFQESHDTYFFLADCHAITVRQKPKDLRHNTLAMAAWYMASGLDPQKCTLFAQSHVRQHTELGWYLQTFTQMGELERMTQFKDKSQRHAQNINAGLFTYPSLQAADILLYDINDVPVGDDQRQHLELTRTIAERFNAAYDCNVFVVPETVTPRQGARLKDLQSPTKKMSKSVDTLGTIFLEDPAGTLVKKIKKAQTDQLGVVAYDPENQAGVSNLLEIYAACAGTSVEEAVAAFDGQQYGAFKQAVADAVVAKVAPVQSEYQRLMADPVHLQAILAQGAEKAAVKAEAKVKEVKEKMGFLMR